MMKKLLQTVGKNDTIPAKNNNQLFAAYCQRVLDFEKK
jgi:hypothetical protein